MFFLFICGEQTFLSPMKGYEGIVCQCYNCGNMSARAIKRRPFFTFCFIPIIPFTITGFKEVYCHICRFRQPISQRPDMMAMVKGGLPPPPSQQQQQYQYR